MGIQRGLCNTPYQFLLRVVPACAVVGPNDDQIYREFLESHPPLKFNSSDSVKSVMKIVTNVVSALPFTTRPGPAMTFL